LDARDRNATHEIDERSVLLVRNLATVEDLLFVDASRSRDPT
jgi:hypothetical protein